jgi:hypothetical protein
MFIDEGHSSLAYFRLHLLSHTSINCDERAMLVSKFCCGAIAGMKEIPVTRPMRNEVAMAANFTGWTLPKALLLPIYLGIARGKRGAVSQVGFGPHRNKPL